jgi:hypothetical protein
MSKSAMIGALIAVITGVASLWVYDQVRDKLPRVRV